ncbi:MAG: FliM/FliN family flagellar motor switch protein [Pseudomonadota bacterium]
MADEELLSQQEIDALLNHSGGDEDVEPGARDDVRPYQLGREQHPSKGRLPTLEMIAERFARELGDELRDLFRVSFEVGASGVETRSFADYCDSTRPPVSMAVCRFDPLAGSGLLAIDATFIHGLVDLYFGGDGSSNRTRDQFSPTELRIVNRVRERTFQCWDASWTDILPIRTTLVAEESNPHLVNTFAAGDLLTCVSFSLAHEALAGTMLLGLPYKGLEAHRPLLDSLGRTEGDDVGVPWEPRLTAALMDAAVPLRCQIATAQLQLKDLMALKPGDVLDAQVPPDHQAYVANIPIFKGKLGESSGKLALELRGGLTHPGKEFIA